ncbi:IS30 family transposase [Gramella sp. Hel_I_59]|uniref:IS30 family transposase n=1 Tax=Gramella sp. Hel_I_59 TaxID=1249978 RepID=UPI0011503C70|nr:IS30 family transposase [Gramella sp. Hel_I_59]TQI71285.1 IS30 family transposase [Gramella sp. Hel_I_59]
MELKKHRRLSHKERVIIQTLLEENRSKSFIAIKLGRSRSTITREVNRWITKPGEYYSADIADYIAKDDYLNKKNKDKISTYKRLCIYVYKGLLKDWSPEQISGRIKDDYPNDPVMTISHEAIYQHIYNKPQARLNLKLIKLLARGTQRRRSRKKRKVKGSRIIDQVSIDQRPAHINLREESGHWEGDLMVGANHKSVIGTIIERKFRYTLIVKLDHKKADHVSKKFSKTLNQMDPVFKKTMTYDNGVEMAAHKKITVKTGMQIYFAHPYSSWERGTNENTNGLIRRYLPKGKNFNTIDEKQLKIIQDKLNNRPRKILGFKTPQEMMDLERKKLYLNT